MTNAKEELRRGKPSEKIEDQSQPVRQDDPAEGEEQAQGTGGGEHQTGVKGRRPVGKGK